MREKRESFFVSGGFLLLVTLTPLLFLPQVWDLYTLPKECFVRLTISFLMVAWVFGNISPRKSGIYFSPLWLPILLYFLALLFSLIHTINPYTGIYEVLRQLTYILLFFLVVNNIKDENPPSPPFFKGGLGGFSSEKDISNICGAAVAGGLLVSILGIFQYFTSFNPDWLYQVARPSATFGNKNMAAEYVIMVIPLSIALFLRAKDERLRLLWAVATIEMVAYVVYAHSRGAWLGLTFGGLVTLLVQAQKHRGTKAQRVKEVCASVYLRLRRPSWRTSLLIFLLSIHLVFPYILPTPTKLEVNYSGRVASALDLESGSASARLAVWANTIDMVRDHPLGVGINNWKVVYPEYSRSQIIDRFTSSETHFEEAHNDYLQMMAEIGVVGFAFYLWILVALVRMCWKSSDAKYLPFFLWGVVGFMTTSLFSFPGKMPVTSLFFWLIAGLIVVRSDIAASPGRREMMQGGGLFNLSFLGFSVILLISMAFFSYFQIFSDYYLHQANILRARDRTEDSVKAYSRAIKLNPFSYWAYFGRGKAHYELNDFAASVRDNLYALRFYPSDINAHGNLGLAYAEQGLFNLAEKEYRETLRLYPEDGRARYRLKELEQKRTSYLKAKDDYEKSQALSPYSAKTCNYRGHLYFLAGLYDEAIAWYKKAILVGQASRLSINKDHQHAQAHNNLANAYRKKGLIDLAIEEHEKAISIDPGFVQAYRDLGKSYEEKGLFKETLEAYFGALRLKPDDADIHFDLGGFYLTRLYDKNRAIFHLKKSLELNPDHPRAEQIREVFKILRRS